MAPYSCGDKLYGGEVVFRALVVSGCYAPKLFDPVEEPFHEVPLAIDPGRKYERVLAVCLRRDVGPGFSLSGLGPNGIAVITLVGQQDISLAQFVCQRVGLGAVGDLSTGQAKGDGATFSVNERVDFARKSAAGTSHATIISIPFFPVAACW